MVWPPLGVIISGYFLPRTSVAVEISTLQASRRSAVEGVDFIDSSKKSCPFLLAATCLAEADGPLAHHMPAIAGKVMEA